MTRVTLIDADGGDPHHRARRGALVRRPAAPPALAGRLRGGARHPEAVGRERAGRSGRHRLGCDARLPPPRLVVGPRGRRRDGHRPAQHGAGHRRHPGAHPPQRGGGAVRSAAASSSGSTPTSSTTRSSRSTPSIDAYLEQLHFAEDAGAGVVLMASRHLARAADSARRLRARLPGGARGGERAGHPALARRGVRPAPRAATSATPTRRCCASSRPRATRSRGIKMCLLDAEAEIALRARLPRGRPDVHRRRLQLRRADRGRRTAPHSDALLGAFAALAPNASAAIQALDAGDVARYRGILGPTEALSRQIFAAPTQYYKTGVAFLSWLNGHQAAFSMVGGLHAARSLPHLSEIVRLADACGALEHPELAAERWTALLRVNGVERMNARDRCPRLSINQATIKSRDLADALRLTAEAGIPRSACGANRSPRSGSREAARLVADSGLAGLEPVPRRLLHGAGGRRPTGGARRQPPGDRRDGRPRSARRSAACSCSWPVGCPTGRRDLIGRAGARGATPSRSWPRRARRRGPPRDRAAAPDVRRRPRRRLDARPGARPRRAVPRGVGRRRRRHLPRVVGPGACSGRSRAPAHDGRIASYQVCDWVTPIAADALLARGMMGDGDIDFGPLTRAVADAGYRGDVEVEIFNQALWDAEPAGVLQETIRAFGANVPL